MSKPRKPRKGGSPKEKPPGARPAQPQAEAPKPAETAGANATPPAPKPNEQAQTESPENQPTVAYTREELAKDMMRGLITEPLISLIKKSPTHSFDIIIALNEYYPEGVQEAQKLVIQRLQAITPPVKLRQNSATYVFATLTGEQILKMVAEYRAWVVEGHAPLIYRVWQDQEIRSCITKSISTVKADACHRAFNSLGEGIVWAVLDSGIDASHQHFAGDTIETSLSKIDFSGEGADSLHDGFGHGTHVAGIIAGGWKSTAKRKIVATEIPIEGSEETEVHLEELDCISGIAPKARLASMKVLDSRGVGKVSAVLLAIEEIQRINQNGRRLRIHGANLSLGYDFNPRWFGCGQSPLCVEVDRLVRSGVAVVVAAGNSGFSSLSQPSPGVNQLGYRGLSINDPGNSALAITVGATHRDMPHTYGVSFFSSRGPTGDGRLKPDLVAPGERIISCAGGSFKDGLLQRLAPGSDVQYLEQTGTSMAAPHVSGAIAAFLSVRREYIGQPEKVKRLFLDNAIDLQRERAFQGYGMLDLLKVLQAV